MLAVEQAQPVYTQLWVPFVQKMSGRATMEVMEIGPWLLQHTPRICARLFDDAPRTLLHNDYQASNLYFDGPADEPVVTVADWQLTTPGRGPLDLAWLLGSSLDTALRREHEMRLLRLYHGILVSKGVGNYPFDTCVDDYRIGLLYGFFRFSGAIAGSLVPPEQDGGVCDVTIPRYVRALHDL